MIQRQAIIRMAGRIGRSLKDQKFRLLPAILEYSDAFVRKKAFAGVNCRFISSHLRKEPAPTLGGRRELLFGTRLLSLSGAKGCIQDKPMRFYNGGFNKVRKEAGKGLESQPLVVYVAPFSGALKRVKVLSVTTCFLSMTLGPVVTFYTLPGVSILVKGTIATLMMLLSASTTAGLHWFSSPYIHKLAWRPGADRVQVELLSWMATKTTYDFNLSEVKAADTQRPLVTFVAKGKYLYVDRDSFPDQELYRQLDPNFK